MTCETGAVRRGVTMRWRKRGSRDSIRAMREGWAASFEARRRPRDLSCELIELSWKGRNTAWRSIL